MLSWAYWIWAVAAGALITKGIVAVIVWTERQRWDETWAGSRAALGRAVARITREQR